MATRPSASEMYVCGSCNARYARADHLIRHVRSHTQQRPFVCTVCAKGFGRQDLLKRHMNGHNVTTSIEAAASKGDGLHNSRHTHRVHQACRSCAEKKLKCADEKPCKRCRERNLVCDFESNIRAPGQSESNHTSDSHLAAHSYVPTRDIQDNANNLNFDQHSSTQRGNRRAEPQDVAMAISQPSQDVFTTPSEPMLLDILGDTLNFAPIRDYGQLDHDTSLEDMDFSFLNDLSLPEMPALLPLSPLSDVTSQQSTMAIGAEAYRGMSALSTWNPRKGDNYMLEQQDLILSQNVRTLTHDVHLSDSRAFPKKDLPSSLRDQILAMVLRTASRAASSRIVTSFPSIEKLRDLIHHALQHMRERQVGNFIHAPSFNLGQQRPELLGSLIAYGCVTSSLPAVRRFGYALQDTVRVAINELAQDEHAALRDLSVAQAFYMQLYLGYWSGTNRKIEITESNSMLGATMLRRGERLRADHYDAPEAFLNLSDASPDQRWLRWVEQESAKRLVYFAMTLDSHVAAARRMNALFNHDEMNTPLPSSTRLWDATTAADWLENIAQESVLRTRQPLPLSRVLRHPHLLAQNTVLTDNKFAASVYLAGCWALIEEYWRMTALLSGTKMSNDFVLNARHSELTSMLELFKAEVTDQYENDVGTLILQELVFLHLHVSFNDVAQYCGKGTEEDARASAAFIQRWFQTSHARTAVWHAGQIFRASKLLPVGALADVYIVALYHAGLVLWIWGLLCRVQTITSISSGQKAVIDGEETSETTRFIKTGRCKPYLTDQFGKTIPIEDSTMIPDLVKGIITTNWDHEPMPLTTTQLFRFMHDIAKVSSQRFGTGYD